MSNGEKNSDEGLIRTIGPAALGTNIFNMVVGAGIFVLPATVALELGSAAIVAYLICAIAVAMIFLCYAEIGSRITRSGGSYAYIEDAFGQFAGYTASTLLWFGWAVFSDAAITIIMVDTIAIGVPLLNDPVWRGVFIISALAFMAYTNVIGVKSGIRLSITTTIAKIVPLLLLVVFGVAFINFDNLVIQEMPPMANIGAATLILIFAFSGAETALNASGEVKNPSRNVPLGLLLGMGTIFVLYVGLQTVAQGVLGEGLTANKDAPLAAAAEVVFGEWGLTMLLVGAAVSIFGTLSGDILSTPRVIFAAARDGNLPSALGKVHPTYKTPHRAIILYAAAICIIALSGTFQYLAVLASGSILLVYLGVSAAVLKVRMRDGPPIKGQFSMPGAKVVPYLSSAVIIWMLVQLSFWQWIGLLAMLAGIVILYVVQKVILKK